MFEMMTAIFAAAIAWYAVRCVRQAPDEGRFARDDRTFTNETDWRWFQADA